jgi:hypothetical protein
MDDPLKLDRPFHLGLQIGYLMTPPVTQDAVHHSVQQFKILSEQCGLSTGAYGSLDAMTAGWSNVAIYPTPPQLLEIKASLNSIAGQIAEETAKIRVVKLLDSNVSGMLRSLDADLSLSPPQAALCQETIRCLECGAFRSGIVMGWNTIYDYIRTWIIADAARLAEFNGRLANLRFNKGTKRGQPKHAAITNYVGIRDLKFSERETLTHLRQLTGVNGDSVDHLIHSLNRRNKYAHATDTAITLYLANAYVEDLIVLAEHDFKHDAKAAFKIP